jgi:hypothetical protein
MNALLVTRLDGDGAQLWLGDGGWDRLGFQPLRVWGFGHWGSVSNVRELFLSLEFVAGASGKQVLRFAKDDNFVNELLRQLLRHA